MDSTSVMWCDVMWCDVMWCDVMWCDVMWCCRCTGSGTWAATATLYTTHRTLTDLGINQGFRGWRRVTKMVKVAESGPLICWSICVTRKKILRCGNHRVNGSSVRPLIHGFINCIGFSKVRLSCCLEQCVYGNHWLCSFGGTIRTGETEILPKKLAWNDMGSNPG
jgi:hypothetical protein